MNKKSILVVSFGTTFNDNKEKTIGAIETALDKAFPDRTLKKAFTSKMIINILKKRDNLLIDHVEDAINKAINSGVTDLLIQPTLMIPGLEYMAIQKLVDLNKSNFSKIVLGDPLLSTKDDFIKVVNAITNSKIKEDAAICFMGHGTSAPANKAYTILNDLLHDMGYTNYFVGTVEASPTCDDLINLLKKENKYNKVYLYPLMIVAGDHANNDLADKTNKNSWISKFTQAGFSASAFPIGLGENKDIQNIFVEHAKKIDL